MEVELCGDFVINCEPKRLEHGKSSLGNCPIVMVIFYIDRFIEM